MVNSKEELFILENEEVYVNDLDCTDESYPNLASLFQFLCNPQNEHQEINPTAAHYFYQIVSSLINKSQIRTLSYIYSHRVFLRTLISRTEVASFKLLLSKIVHFYKDDDKSDTSFKFLKYRFTLLKKIFDALMDLKESDFSTSNRDLFLAKEKNLADLLNELFLNKEKIIDSEYFTDQIFCEKHNIKRLLNKIRQRKSPDFLRMLSLILSHLYTSSDRFKDLKNKDLKVSRNISEPCRNNLRLNKAENEEDVELELPEISERRGKYEQSSEPEPSRGRRSGIPQSFAFDQNAFENEVAEQGEESPTIKKKHLQLTLEQDNKPLFFENEDLDNEDGEMCRENKSTAETSNGPINNIELELYDEGEIKKGDISEYLFDSLPWIIADLFNENISSSRSITTTISKEYRPSGAYKIAVLRFLTTIAKLKVLEDKFQDFVTCELLEKALGLFSSFPTNNLIHFELTSLFEILIVYIFDFCLEEDKSNLINTTIDCVFTLFQAFMPESAKINKHTKLFRPHLLKIIEKINQKLNSSKVQIEKLSQNWKVLLGVFEMDNLVIDNAVFKLHKEYSVRPSMQDIFGEDFQFSDVEIEKILNRKKSNNSEEENLLQGEDSGNYSSQRADVNKELLNNLLHNLNFATDNHNFENYVEEEMLDYEVRLDLDLQEHCNGNKNLSFENESKRIEASGKEERRFSDLEYWKTGGIDHDVDGIIESMKH